MTKKEKIIALALAFSIFFMILSSIYTIFYNKPEGYKFRIERLVQRLF